MLISDAIGQKQVRERIKLLKKCAKTVKLYADLWNKNYASIVKEIKKLQK